MYAQAERERPQDQFSIHMVEMIKLVGNVGNSNCEQCRFEFFKVPQPIRGVNEDCYNPQLISFGLYGRMPFDDRWAKMEQIKLETASAVVRVLKDSTDEEKRAVHVHEPKAEGMKVKAIWKHLCTTSGRYGSWEQIRNLYSDVHPDLSITLVSHLLVLDAVLLISFMLFQADRRIGFQHGFKDYEPVIHSIFRRKGILCNVNIIASDIWLFENQIPLLVIKAVFRHMYLGDKEDRDEFAEDAFRALVGETVRSLLRARILPGNFEENIVVKTEDECRRFSHVLECLYRLLPSGEQDCSSYRDGQVHKLDKSRQQNGFVYRISHVLGLNSLLRQLKKGTKEKEKWPGPQLVRQQNFHHRFPSLSREVHTPEIRSPLSPTEQPGHVHSGRSGEDPETSDRRRIDEGNTSETEVNVDSYIYTLPTVTNLQEVGIQVEGDSSPGFDCTVRLKPSSKPWETTTLQISPLNVDGSTERFLRNLVAFEIVSTSECKLLTYLQCMDDLINTGKDVCLLKEGRPAVIVNSSMDEKDVARLFNRMLLNCTVYQNSELKDIRRRVRFDYHQQWRRSWREFKERYSACNNPWVAISLFAGFLILSLTAIQTVYAVIGNYK